MDEVVDSIVIGRPIEGDVEVMLFVQLADGVSLDEALVKKIRGEIRAGCTPRHVPASRARGAGHSVHHQWQESGAWRCGVWFSVKR